MSKRRTVSIREHPDYCDFVEPLQLAARDLRMPTGAYARVLVIQGLLRAGYLDESDLKVR
jgi:hypothetical protein